MRTVRGFPPDGRRDAFRHGAHRFHVGFVVPRTFAADEGDFAGAGLSGDPDGGGGCAIEGALFRPGFAEVLGVITRGAA